MTTPTAPADINTDSYETKYGFFDKDEALFKSNKGLTPEIVAMISEMKDEPQWMRDFRQRSLETFREKSNPAWGEGNGAIEAEFFPVFLLERVFRVIHSLGLILAVDPGALEAFAGIVVRGDGKLAPRNHRFSNGHRPHLRGGQPTYHESSLARGGSRVPASGLLRVDEVSVVVAEPPARDEAIDAPLPAREPGRV